VHRVLESTTALTGFRSDGSTPAKQTEQILAITPILKGQKPNQRNRIPRRSESYRSTYNETTSTNDQSKPKQQPLPIEGDLIDFGQNDEPQTQKPHYTSVMPSDLLLAQTQNNGQQQKDLEKTLRATSKSPPQKGTLIDFHEDMNKDLPKLDGSTLKRQDTGSSSLDEFVDAEG
jgi:oxysterol-binding protein-related protein 8